MQVASLAWGILALIGFGVGIIPCLGWVNWINIPFAGGGSDFQHRRFCAGQIRNAVGLFLGHCFVSDRDSYRLQAAHLGIRDLLKNFLTTERQGRVSRLWIAVLLGPILSFAQSPPSDPLPSFTASDLAIGKKLFEAHCAPCHGIDGTGGKGANLTAGKLKRVNDNQAFFDIAKNGIEGTIMDGAWQLSDGEIWRVVAYGRSLGKTARVSLPGDPLRGKAAYQSLGCSGCHIVSGQGRGFGPELTTIGARRSAGYLKEAIVSPGATVPEEFAMVRIRTRDGRDLEAVRVNEDSFTIQVKDAGNRFSSFRKGDLESFELLPGTSAMPTYSGRISPSDLDDLVAYLAALRDEL